MPGIRESNRQPNNQREVSEKVELNALVMHCIIMRLNEKEALKYLKSRGCSVGRTQYYDSKKRLEESTIHKAYRLAAENGLIEQHMERIRQLETIEREHWQNYHREKNPLKRSLILEKVTTLQPYLSSAYDCVKEIIREQAELQAKITPEKLPKDNTIN